VNEQIMWRKKVANRQRVLKSSEYETAETNSGTRSISMNSQASKAFSPMRNKDILQAEAGDWSALLEKTARQTNAFRRRFYA
jgi:hypothetical protein